MWVIRLYLHLLDVGVSKFLDRVSMFLDRVSQFLVRVSYLIISDICILRYVIFKSALEKQFIITHKLKENVCSECRNKWTSRASQWIDFPDSKAIIKLGSRRSKLTASQPQEGQV